MTRHNDANLCTCEARSHLRRILGLIDTMAALGLALPPVGQRLVREAKAHLDGGKNGSRGRHHEGEHEDCPYLATLIQGEDGPAYFCNKCGSGWPATSGREATHGGGEG